MLLLPSTPKLKATIQASSKEWGVSPTSTEVHPDGRFPPHVADQRVADLLPCFLSSFGFDRVEVEGHSGHGAKKVTLLSSIMLFSAMVEENLASYFEVELKEVKLRDGNYVIDPEKAVEMVDENTICVAAIRSSTLNGEFKDVKLLNDLLIEQNKETRSDTPIHVDDVSGGFIAPFLYPELEWDFRLPPVKSINVNGHKYGLVYAGIRWVV